MPNVYKMTLDTIFCEQIPLDVPVFLDWHIYDIPETMRKAIENAPNNVVEISFNETEMPIRWKRKISEWCLNCNIQDKWWKNNEQFNVKR